MPVCGAKQKGQEYANRIVVYSDMIEVSLKGDSRKEDIEYVFSELFGKHYDAGQEAVLLEWNNEKLSIGFDGDEPEKNDKYIPLFRKILYKDSDIEAPGLTWLQNEPAE